jgi:hypothetical protein
MVSLVPNPRRQPAFVVGLDAKLGAHRRQALDPHLEAELSTVDRHLRKHFLELSSPLSFALSNNLREIVVFIMKVFASVNNI